MSVTVETQSKTFQTMLNKMKLTLRTKTKAK